MEKVVTVKEMRRHEEYTCRQLSLAVSGLMLQVGRALFRHFRDYFLPDVMEKILVVAGTGNNGCDALVFARAALEEGYDVQVYVIGGHNAAGTDWHRMHEALPKGMISYYATEKELETVSFSTRYVIDGLFGTGLSRAVEGPERAAIAKINASDAFVYSIDIPSGIHADTGMVMGIAVKADLCGSVQFLKFGNLLSDAMDHAKTTEAVDCGMLFDEREPKRNKEAFEDLGVFLDSRKHNSHKYDYGSILVIGGHPGMMGAPQLAAMAALRSGAGLVTLAIRKADLAYFTQFYPEIMTGFYDTIEELAGLLEKKDLVIFGPGLGKGIKLYEDILVRLLADDIPLLVDADGLDYLKDNLHKVRKGQKIVITPHLGELARLRGLETDKVRNEVLTSLSEFTESGLTVVLKGATTITCDKERMILSSEGNPGLATAGTGDILAGIIGALMGQGLDAYTAAHKGVLLHSLAASKAREARGERAMVASDLIWYL